MKATERRLNDEKEKLSNEIFRIKKQIEEKEAEKIRAVRDAKADGDQRVRPRCKTPWLINFLLLTSRTYNISKYFMLF